MGKLGENVPLIIDKAVDFMASSQAFMEYLKKSSPESRTGRDPGRESGDVSGAIRTLPQLYQPVENQAKEV
jgi:hypothetical protein